MKTVWHWKNIGKTIFCLLVAATVFALISAALNIPDCLSTLIGFAIGWAAVMLSMAKWECWHFEYD